MRQNTPVIRGLFSFSLQTQLTIPTCLHKLEIFPTVGVRGTAWNRLFFQVRLEGISREANSFCLTVYRVHWPTVGATAKVSLERVDEFTLVNGRIQNLAWKYLFFVPFYLFLPVLLLLTAYSLPTGAGQNAIITGILPFLLLYGGYIHPTLRYRALLIDAIRYRLADG
jgi:hypothetical protein